MHRYTRRQRIEHPATHKDAQESTETHRDAQDPTSMDKKAKDRHPGTLICAYVIEYCFLMLCCNLLASGQAAERDAPVSLWYLFTKEGGVCNSLLRRLRVGQAMAWKAQRVVDQRDGDLRSSSTNQRTPCFLFHSWKGWCRGRSGRGRGPSCWTSRRRPGNSSS